MPRIEIETLIKNDSIRIVFDLARSIDLHKISTKKTKEEAIAGKTSGLISINETVTWRAKHLGFYHTLTSKITDFNEPTFFADEMQKGIFKSFRHEHYFKQECSFIILKDIFEYRSPYGFIGRIVDALFLKSYMRKFLQDRNKVIKEYAESDLWKSILKS